MQVLGIVFFLCFLFATILVSVIVSMHYRERLDKSATEAKAKAQAVKMIWRYVQFVPKEKQDIQVIDDILTYRYNKIHMEEHNGRYSVSLRKIKSKLDEYPFKDYENTK